MGGAAGAHIRKGDLLCVVDGEDAALQISGRFMNTTREREVEGAHLHLRAPHRAGAHPGHRRGRRDGTAAALDAAMKASTDAAYDPWKEAVQPRTVNQFAEVVGE